MERKLDVRRETVDKPEPRLEVPAHGNGLLRRDGNRGGNANSGRYPSIVRAACRAIFDDGKSVAESILHDPEASPSDRLKALDILGKYGLGTRTELAGDPDHPIGVEVVVRVETRSQE